MGAGVAISTITFQPGYAPLAKPVNTAVDLQGNVYISDCNTHTIRKLTPDGTLSVLAGSGAPGSMDGTGSGASFFNPTGVAVDASGMVYVADYNNNLIRTVTPQGKVTTIAGQPEVYGHADGTGSNALFANPAAIAVDGNGIIYVTDQGNNTVRRVTQLGQVTTLAGTAGPPGSMDGLGPAARFSNPCGIAVDGSGTIYVCDQRNETIRLITPVGQVSTIAGQVGVPGSQNGAVLTSATFNYPTGIAVDEDGTVYVTDYNTSIIRSFVVGGQVSTIAGTAGVTGSTNATGSAASFLGPEGIAVDGAHRLYIADTFNNLIRRGLPVPATVPSSNDAWQPLGTGVGFNDSSGNWGMTASGSQVYISGVFTSVDGISASGIAEWTGGGWAPLGAGLNGAGDDINVSGGTVFEIGKFTTAGGVSATNVAAWDGLAWSALGTGLPNYPYAATIYTGQLVVGGGYSDGMGGFIPFVESWNGSQWSTIGTGTGGWVYTLVQYGNDLIIGGDYGGLGGAGNDYLVSWDGTSLSLPGGGVNANASQSMVSNGVLYVDGIFTTAGGNPATNIASWNGTSWQSLGSSFTGGNEALVPAPGGIYAFGSGTNTPGNAAFWNGTIWSAVPGGTNGETYEAVSTPGGIVVTGPFTQAGGKTANGVAIYNPQRIAYAGTLQASVHTPAPGTLSALDALGNALTISLLSQPLHGSVVLLDAAAGTYQYTGASGYVGTDTFVFQGQDYTGVSNPATVVVTVIDTSPPAVSITSPSSANFSVASTAPITFSGSDSDDVGVVSLSYTLTGATTASASLALGPTWSFTTPVLGLGTTTLVVTAHDAAGNAGTATLTVLAGVPTITSALSQAGTVGQPLAYAITATGLPSSYSATGLPAGTSINAATGAITGTPTANGVSVATVGATNGIGTGTAQVTFTIAPSVPTITSSATASGRIGTRFSYTIVATGNPVSFGLSPVPAGLAFDAITGVLSGTLTEVGVSVLTLTATNASGSGTASLTLTVEDQLGNGRDGIYTNDTGRCGSGGGIAGLLLMVLGWALSVGMHDQPTARRRKGRAGR